MRWLSILAAFAASLECTQALKFPSEDPFYEPPARLGKYKPGQVLRRRQVKSVLSKQAFISTTYQYLYRTTNSLGHATAAVTTLIVPKRANPKKMVSYQFAYDACFIDCSPSYFLQKGAKKNMSDSAEFPLVDYALGQGWYVNSPDYEGNKAAYVAGVLSGQATLDSVRAVLSERKRNGLARDPRYVMWGYSGGALASEWAAELQPTYAPELKFAGAALGGLTPNISRIVLVTNGTKAAGLIPPGTLGLAKEYPEFRAYLNRQLVPSKKKAFRKALTQCFDQDAVQFYKQDIFQYFKSGRGVLTDPIPRRTIEAAGIMGRHGVPGMPLYAYKAIHDEISPVEDTTALVKKLCKGGSNIEYVMNTKGNHEQEAEYGFPAAFSWLGDRLAGEEVKSGCTTKKVTVT